MQRLRATAVGVALLISTGCAASTVTTTPDKAGAKGGSGAGAARVGQPVTIKGNDSGSKLQVTVKKVQDTRPADQFSTVDKGKRLVAVQFRLVNTGTATYSDAPSNGAKVVDKQGQQYEADIFFDKIAAGPMLPSSMKLAPKNKALGYLTFQVPKRSKIAQVQFSMDSGFGGTGQWKVK